MKKIIPAIFLLCALAFGQVPFLRPNLSYRYYATQFNWMIGASLVGNAGQTGTITFDNSYIPLPDGSRIIPWKVGVPVTINDGSATETVTLTGVNCPGGQNPCSATATFTHAHNVRTTVQSGTVGLQEAIDAAHVTGGIVVIDPSWYGQTSLIASAAGYTNVLLEDERSGNSNWYGWNGSSYAESLQVGATGVNLALGTLTNPTINAGALGGTFTGSPTFSGSPVFSGTIFAKNFEQVRYADQYSGSDAGAKIAACLADLPSTGGICDATALNGAQTWSEDVLSAAVGPFVLRLGAGTTTVSHAQTIAQPATISGQGSSTILSYTPTTGTFLTWEYGSTSGVATNVNVGMRDLRILGPGRSNLGVVAMQFGPSSGTATAYGMTFYDVAIQDFDTVFLLQDNAYFIDFFKLYTENTGTVLKVPASGITNSGEHVAFIDSILSDGGVAVNWQAANGDLFMTDVSLDYDSGIDGSGSVLGDVYMTASAGTFHGMHLESSAPHDFIHAIGTATVSVDGWNGVSAVVASQAGLSASRSSNVVTVTYTGGSLPYANEPIAVGGCADASFDGNFTVSTATSTKITYEQTAANASTTGCTVAINWSQFFDIGGGAWAKITGGQANMAGGRLAQIVFSDTSGYVSQYQNQPLQVAGVTGDGVVAGYNGPTANTPFSFNAVTNRTDIGSTNIWLNGTINFNGSFGTNAKFPYGYALNFGAISGTDGYVAGNSSGRLAIRGQVNGITFRNNADTTDNVIFADDGTTTFAGPVDLNDGGSIASGKTLTNSGTITGGTVNATTLQQGGVNAALQGVDINSSNQVTATHSATLNGATTVAAAGRFKLADQGQCTMTSGTCSAQALGSTYTSAPICIATWTGTGTLTGQIKIASTTTTVTPSSANGTDTAQVNWACFGN